MKRTLAPAERRVLMAAWLSEVQAIAIYRAELVVLRRSAAEGDRRKTLELCEEILLEEVDHALGLERELDLGTIDQFKAGVSRLGGFAIGFALSSLPSRISWKAHAWAERQAAKIYDQAHAVIPMDELKSASIQESTHADRFENLLKR